MATSEIAQCLAATLSPDGNTRVSAELKLAKLSESPEAGLALSQLLAAQDASVALRQISQTVFCAFWKYVKERWSPYFPTFRGSAPQVEIKAQIRQAVFNALSDPHRKVRTLSAHILSSIASCDWPDEYPDLLNSLMTLLSSGSSDAVHGAMQMFTDFVKSELSEDQLLPVLQQLLPVLLSILGAPEHHSPLTRARTITVFRQCVESLAMVQDLHPESVNGAIASVFPVWLDAFKVLLNMDPRNDVESTPNWDGIAIKREVIKTIDTIRNGFPRVLKPHLPDFLTAALKHLTALFPTYYHYYVLAEDSVPNSSEDEKIELSQFASSTLDLLANVARNGGAKTWFDQSNVTALIAEVFRWAEMTTDDETEWAHDPNAFVAQESEESTSYSVRVAGFDLIDTLLERTPALSLSTLQTNIERTVVESSQAKENGQQGWWRPLEAGLAAIGGVHSTIFDSLDIEGRSGQPDPINVKQLLVDVVPNLLSLSEFPFLQGRAFVFASQFAKLLPSELAGNYLDAVIQVLESQDGSIPVKVSAILAAKGFCKNSGVSTVVPRAPRICKCIEGFVQITTADTLTLIQETLSALLSVQEGQWMTVQLAESLIPATLNVMHNNIRDPVLMATISSILGQLAAVPIPGMYEVVISHAVPILCQAIVQPDGSPAAAIDQVCGLLEGAPQGKLGANFMNTLAPCLFGAMKTMEDRDGIQAGISALTLIVKKDCRALVEWRDPSTGGSGLDCTLQLIATLLETKDESGSLFIGDLIIQIIRNAGDAILPILPELLQAMVRRMTSAKTATFVQSLVIPFAFLIHSGHRDTVLGLLESFDVNGRSGLNVFINTWCENAETFQGYWNTRVNSLALIDVFMSQRPSLQNLLVKGDLIIDPGTEGVIMTRSKTRAVPTQFTSIPFPLKALKLLLHDLQTESEPASLGYMGIKESDVADLDSDDGDEEWDTEATAEALDVGSDDLTRMLGGHGVPPEMVGIVAEMAATPSMRSTPTQFERDPLYDTDGEDLSDPIYQVDLRDCIISFVRGCATQNTSNFSAIVDKLTPEEIMVARKAVTGEQNGSESF